MTETESVYCAVRPVQFSRPCYGSAILSTASHRARPDLVVGQSSKCCGGQYGTGRGCSQSYWVFVVDIVLTEFNSHLHVYVVLTRRKNGQSLGTFPTMFFSKWVKIGQRSTFTFSQSSECSQYWKRRSQTWEI